VLHDFIDDLNANGWTAIDLGMKMGVALLDPASRDRAERSGRQRVTCMSDYDGPARQLRRSRDDQGHRADDGR
jgi:hypothetical protein